MSALLVATVTARTDVEPGWIHVDAPFVMKPQMDAVKAKWDAPHHQFRVPLTWGNCLALRTELGDDLTLDPSLVEWARKYRGPAKGLLDLREKHEREIHRPAGPGFDTMFKHQMSGVDLIMRSQALHRTLGDGMGARYLVLDETGVGKTRVALGAIAELEVSTAVILCPKSVIRVWHDEAQLFFPGADIREVHGSAVARRKALAPGGFLYIMSYESLRSHSRVLWYPGCAALTDEQRHPREIQALHADMLIVDEVHRCASPRTVQTRAAWAVADEVEHVIAMTGTPIQESPEDLWAVLRLLDRKSFPGITAFRERYLDVVINPYGGYDIRGLNPLTQHEFFDLFHTMSRRATKAEVLPFLPPKVYEIRWVDLPPDNRRAYRQMEKQYLLEVTSGAVTSAANPMVAAGRLIQLANATLDVLPSPNPDSPDVVRMISPSPKVKAFMDDIAAGDYADMSVVVFSDSKQLIDLLAEAFDESKTPITYEMITGDVEAEDRNRAIRRFQSGEVQYILITRAGDTGITLTRASVMVRLTRSWSYVTHVQAEDRVHRIGSEQHQSVLYLDYIVEDSVEEGQIVRLNSKREKATEVLSTDELKELMTR
jgi:SNF2 family DNA or RNA helicase